MRVHAHTKFCFLCVLTLIFHQCTHCHDSGHDHHSHGHDHHNHDHDHGHDHDHDHDLVHSDLQISKASYISQSDNPAPSSPSETAEHEQRFYIQKLFNRYGRQDRLDFRGFQSLLLSLGLGEVRVVGLEHEDLGHDHVAHLDLLEVQEGLHSHSASHSQTHPHPKSHSHPNHHHHSHGEANGGLPTAQGPCSPSVTSEARPTTDSGPLDRHSHDLEHEHEHEDEHDQHKSLTKTDNEHTHDGHEHSHDVQPQQIDHTSLQDQQSQENNDLGQGTTLDSVHTHSHEVPHHHHEHHHHHKHPHPHNHHHHVHTPDPTDHLSPTQPTQTPPHLMGISSNAEASYLQLSSATQTPTTKPKRVRRPTKARGQRTRNKTQDQFAATITPEVDGPRKDPDTYHDDHFHSQGQSHKGKREVPEEIINPNISSQNRHSEDVLHQHEEVINFSTKYKLCSQLCLDLPISNSQTIVNHK